VPRLDVSSWTDDAVLEQLERLEVRGAEPRVTRTLCWLSAAERSLRDQERADAARCAGLRAQGLKGANKVKAVR
jgi:hypothetical protein